MAAYTSLKATPEAVGALRKIALQMSANVGRRLSMSDVLGAVCAVAERHPDEITAALQTNGATP